MDYSNDPSRNTVQILPGGTQVSARRDEGLRGEDTCTLPAGEVTAGLARWHVRRPSKKDLRKSKHQNVALYNILRRYTI